MPGINEVYSDNPMRNYFGVITGSASFTQFPSGSAKLARFKANPDNIGMFEIVEWGSNNQGTWILDAGDDTGWFAAPYFEANLLGLKQFGYRNLSGTSDYLHYWVQL